MSDVTSNPILQQAEVPHAIEVHTAQAALDDCGTVGRTGTTLDGNANTDREIVRSLVAAYGAEGVRQMIDTL
jgi:hypothetical protein